MSNELAMLDKGLPSHLKALDLDDTTKALMGSGGGGAKRISIDGSVWRLLVNGKEIAQKEERSLNVVIVAASSKVSRTYYEGTYKKGQASAPNCWSADGDHPDKSVKEPQAKSCATCPQNIKGSGQGDSKACRFSQRIAVVLDNDIGGDVFQLVLPSTSIFGEGEPGKWPLQMYAKMIGAKGVPITAVVTEMRFDTASSTPKVIFKPVRFLEANEIETAIDQGKSLSAINAITMTVAQTDGVKDAPKLEAPKVEEKAEAPKAEKVEAEEVEEPTKRSAKKEEPAPKKDLSKILSDWDDE
jgi:hypothetical protein